MNINKENYLAAKLLSQAAFEAIPNDDNDNDAEWDAWDEARELEGEAVLALIGWGKSQLKSMPIPAAHKDNVARMIEICERSPRGEDAAKLCELFMTMPE